jgi:hypothetical protein
MAHPGSREGSKLSGTQRVWQMRTCIGIAVVVAIGLIWSVAVMFEWVPVNSADMSAATSSRAITVGQGKIASTK